MQNRIRVPFGETIKGSLASLVLSTGFFFLLCYMVTLSISIGSQIEITAKSATTDFWTLFYAVGPTSPKFSEKRSSNTVEVDAGGKQRLVFKAKKFPVEWLRIDPGSKAGKVQIYSLVIKQQFVQDQLFTAKDIYFAFQAGHPGMTMKLEDGYVEIISTVDDPYLVSLFPLLARQSLGFLVAPIFLFSFYLFRLLCSFSLKQLQTFFWVRRENLPERSVLSVLDGLRGVGALMVIADHTWPNFVGIGASGVMIFFSLSGFLLARPCVYQPDLFFRKGYLLKYGARRIRRILPMYYFYLFLVYVMSEDLVNAVLHAIFFKGEGHLWAIPQEMLFYLVFPCISLFIAIVLKARIGLTVSFLILATYMSYHFLHVDVFSLSGMNNQPLPFYLGAFLSGCCTAYLYFGVFLQSSWEWLHGQLFRCVATTMAIAIISVFLLFSNGYLLKDNCIFSQQYYGIYGAAAAFLILFLLAEQNSILTRCLSHPLFCTVGVVSYSLYLIHPLLLRIILDLNESFFNIIFPGYFLFLLTLMISYPVSVLCYKCVEHPFLRVNKK
jgi:peptidoglycan/LPS O-acetylase OafA/YrhL